ISNIAVCSLVDSAVNLVFEQRLQRRETEASVAFEQIRSTLLTFIQQSTDSNSPENPAWHRFKAIIKSAEFYVAREKFRLVGECLGLKWEGDWQDVFKFWAKWRPRLVHRGTGNDDSAGSVADEFNIGSLVVGAM